MDTDTTVAMSIARKAMAHSDLMVRIQGAAIWAGLQQAASTKALAEAFSTRSGGYRRVETLDIEEAPGGRPVRSR